MHGKYDDDDIMVPFFNTFYSGGSRNNPAVRVFSVSEPVSMLSNFRYFEGFLGQRISPVTQLRYHPSKLLLAVGSADGTITLLGERSTCLL